MAHYCYLCGSMMEDLPIDGRVREICTNCGWIRYEQLKVSAGVMVESDGRLLLAQRGIEPWKGSWYMPAGFVEADEHPARAAEREAFEETGLQVQVDRLVKEYLFTDDPRGNGLLLIYKASLVGGEFRPSPETLAIGYFSAEEIEAMPLAGACSDTAVLDWLQKKRMQNRVE